MCIMHIVHNLRILDADLLYGPVLALTAWISKIIIFFILKRLLNSFSPCM